MKEFDKSIAITHKYWIIEKLETIIKFLTPTNFKKIIFALFCIILFIISQNKIISFIEKYILVSPQFSNFFLDIILIVTSLLIFLILIKLIKNKYRRSYNEIFLSTSLFFILSYYYFTGNWLILSIDLYFFRLQYLYLIIIPLAIFLLLPIIIKYFEKEQVSNENYYWGDDPIFKIEEDRLDSKRVGEKLLEILKNENHSYSFTIGLIGPWGNGKSTVINFVKNDLNENTETIVFQFSPYLNHTENDIINEFFILLSNELEKYSGKVANQIMLYSKKLTTLYKDKNIFNFVEDHISKIDCTSANKLYNEINDRLLEIDKKIIVLVDDLDRLNEKEILEVLKLIRNTANFKNTIFVIAMDKEYILNRLRNNNDILNSAFIDKFFQLEIYLPEIDQSILKNYFSEILENSVLSSDVEFVSKLNDAMLSNENLFSDYIKNIRDIKRVVNQLIYDYPIFKNEINFKDFLNFIYFKLKFPKYLKILNDNKADFIEIDIDKGTYGLISSDVPNSKNSPLDLFDRKSALDYSFLEKYKMYQVKHNCNSIHLDNSLPYEDRLLLMKTLAFLFGTQNTTNDVSSIKSVNNFQMLMQQRIFKDFLTLKEFESLFDDVDLKFVLSNFHSENKISQLINRLSFFNKVNLAAIERGISILVNLYENRREYNLNEAEILFLLNKFVDKIQKKGNFRNEEQLVFTEWLKNNVFENDNFLLVSRLFLLGHLFKSKHLNNLWYLSEKYIEEKVLKLFKEYLDTSSWEVTDRTVYSLYFLINAVNSEKVNSLFKDHWNSHNIELLCAQTIELDAFTTNQFKISDIVIEIFGSKNQFLEFVYKFKDISTDGFKEILSFYAISLITSHTNYIVYYFTKSKIMTAKFELNLKRNESSTGQVEEKISQFFFETNSKSLAAKLLNIMDSNSSNIKIHQYGNDKVVTFYIEILIFDKIVTKEDILNLAKKMIEISDTDFFKPGIKIDKEKLFSKANFMPQNDNDIYVKLFSVQPNLK